MSNAVDLTQGVAYVVTDLHGEAEPYLRYRDEFLTLHNRNDADYLIVLGDVIHGYSDEATDKSLEIVLDIIRLQQELGPQSVLMVLGNHELPHIYGVTLSKGNMEFTQRFEASLGDQRELVIDFFKSLPFIVRTQGGTILTHAGPTASISTRAASEQLLEWKHDKLLEEGSRLLQRGDVQELIQTYMSMTMAEYDINAKYYLAISGPEDPRYLDLLRGLIVSNLKEWQLVWDFFFNQGELGLSAGMYQTVVERFCQAYSTAEVVQKVLVSGHMSVQKGHGLIGKQQLRLASWAHSVPRDSGCYLLFDVAAPVETARDLVPFVHQIP